MNTCPNCGKIAGLHSSILQGCMCQYSMQAPPKKEWQGLTDEEKLTIVRETDNPVDALAATEAMLKEKNT